AKGRIPVVDARFGTTRGWVDAAAVGPSGPPPAAAPAAEPPKAAFQGFWVAPFKDVPLLMDPTAEALPATTLAQFAPVKVTGPAKGNYYPVEEPFAKLPGWVDATALGKVGQPEVVSANR